MAAAAAPLTPVKVTAWARVASMFTSRLSTFFEIGSEVSTRMRAALGALPLMAVMVAWSLLTNGAPEARILSPLILPSPIEVMRAMGGLWFEAELSRSMAASFLRVLVGFAVGCAAAFPVGVLMGAFGKMRAVFEPTTVFLAYLPIPALVPLTMSLFGIGESQKTMFLALAFFIYLVPLFVKAIDDIDSVYLRTAYTLGTNRFSAVRRVLLPIAFPQIVHAMRLGFGVGWTYIILAEMVAADRGLGQIIIVAQRRGPREYIYLVLLAIVIIAYLTDRLWARAYEALFPYKRAQ